MALEIQNFSSSHETMIIINNIYQGVGGNGNVFANAREFIADSESGPVCLNVLQIRRNRMTFLLFFFLIERKIESRA